MRELTHQPNICTTSEFLHSKMDPTKKIDPSQFAITLIRTELHAEILIEYIEEGQYKCKIWHFTVPDSSISGSKNTTNPTNFIPGLLAKAVVECKIIPFEKLQWNTKSPTWLLPLAKVEELERKMKEDMAKGPMSFSIVGHHSFLHTVGTLFGSQKKYSCASWAIEKLHSAGICLKCAEINLITNTLDYTNEKVDIKEPDIHVLCEFAAQGRYKGIQKNFRPGFNVNQKTHGRVGPVEMFLGVYSPLSLAIAYGHLKTAKLLIEEYGADLEFTVGRANDHNALDCAKRNFWFANVSEAKKSEILEYITNIMNKNAQIRSTINPH